MLLYASPPPQQRKNPNWKPDEDGAMFMSQLRESAEATDLKTSSQYPTESLTYISLPQPHPVSHIQRHQHILHTSTFNI